MVNQISAAEAVEIMRARGCRISPDVLRDGLKDRRFPFGECYETKSGTDRCAVYKKLLDQWLDERDEEIKEQFAKGK